MEQKYSGLQKAVSAAGGVEPLARFLKVRYDVLRGWLKADGSEVPQNVRQWNPALDEAIKMAGNQAKLAAELGVTPQSVQAWVRRGFVPSKHVTQIEATYGITRMSLISPKLRSAIGVGGEL